MDQVERITSILKDNIPKWENKLSILNGILFLAGVFSFGLFVSACVVANTANAGFNIVFTSLLNTGLTFGTWRTLRRSKSPIAVGFLIGSVTMMAVINFETAVYWGQLSQCKPIGSWNDVPQFSCDDRAAYGSVSAFAVLMMLCQAAFVGILIHWRHEFIDESGAYDTVEESRAEGVGGRGNNI